MHLFIGYGFCSGLQLQRPDQPSGEATPEGPATQTVESVLVAAVLASGAVIPSNAAALHKMDWSRSSRTDRGVHSLSTVSFLSLE
jgi:tRNA U38,U39,U40 pseudouridine synthase TruA